jgi:hypothetical protein
MAGLHLHARNAAPVASTSDGETLDIRAASWSAADAT